MKKILTFILLVSSSFLFAQESHKITLTINQPEDCIPPLSIEQPLSSDQMGEIDIYPNPAMEAINIEFPEVMRQIKVYSLSGIVEYSEPVLSKKAIIPVTTLSKGVHVVQITTDNHTVFRKILIHGTK